MSWTVANFHAAARSMVSKALYGRDMRVPPDVYEDLVQEAVARAWDKYDPERDPNGKGPIVLIRWKAFDVVKEEAERRKEDETVVMNDRQMNGVWA